MTTLHFVAILVLGFAINDFVMYLINMIAFKEAFKKHKQEIEEIFDNKKDEFDDPDSPIVKLKSTKILH